MPHTLSKPQTRGRPRKSLTQKLPVISRKLFSQHYAVFYACCMVYVLQTFYQTKNQKRIGHSQGGFTIYEKIREQYCFQTLQQDCLQWGMTRILQSKQLLAFVKVINGCAPRIVFRQILDMIEEILKLIQTQKIVTTSILVSKQDRLWKEKTLQDLNTSMPALCELKLERWHTEISRKIGLLWIPFVKVVTYSIYCVANDVDQSKYYKPFFSDAENPKTTIIGQLNLIQIVQAVQNDQNKKKDHVKDQQQQGNQKQNLKFSQNYHQPQNQLQNQNQHQDQDQHQSQHQNYNQHQHQNQLQNQNQHSKEISKQNGNPVENCELFHLQLNRIRFQPIMISTDRDQRVKKKTKLQ